MTLAPRAPLVPRALLGRPAPLVQPATAPTRWLWLAGLLGRRRSGWPRWLAPKARPVPQEPRAPLALRVQLERQARRPRYLLAASALGQLGRKPASPTPAPAQLLCWRSRSRAATRAQAAQLEQLRSEFRELKGELATLRLRAMSSTDAGARLEDAAELASRARRRLAAVRALR